MASYQASYQDSGTDQARLAQSVGNNVQKIASNVAQLDRYVRQIGTPQDSEEVRDKVHQITHSTNELAKETNKELQRLAKLPTPPDTHQARQMKTQKDRLMERFSDELKKFQTIQRTAAEKERASITRARAASGSGYTGFQDEPQEDQFSRPGYSQTAQILEMEQDVDLESIRERETAIKQLERDIMDVNQIFKDLGMLVHEQGEVLDSIEANVEDAQLNVEEGSKQLGFAREYQSKARRKKCCLIVVLLVILGIVAIIIAVTVSNKN